MPCVLAGPSASQTAALVNTRPLCDSRVASCARHHRRISRASHGAWVGVGGDFAGFRAGWVLRHGAARGRLLGAQAVVCAAAAEVVRMGLGVPYNKNLWYAMGEYSR